MSWDLESGLPDNLTMTMTGKIMANIPHNTLSPGHCDMYQCPRCARVWWVPSRNPVPRYCPYCGLEDEEELLLCFESEQK